MFLYRWVVNHIYSIMLGEFIGFNYDYDHTVEEIFNLVLTASNISGKLDIYTIDKYTIVFKTEDFTITTWNKNRYYAWLHDGSIEFKSGDMLTWIDKMPSTKTMYKLKRLIDKRFDRG